MLAELPGGYAVIGDVQFLPGYCLLLGKDPNATALADMSRADRMLFLSAVDVLATAVERACRRADPAFRRVNISILGNTDAFVHAHVWPRYTWEPDDLVTRPVWLYNPANWADPATRLGTQHDRLRGWITDELRDSANASRLVGATERARHGEYERCDVLDA